jgi:hypothetical protein
MDEFLARSNAPTVGPVDAREHANNPFTKDRHGEITIQELELSTGTDLFFHRNTLWRLDDVDKPTWQSFDGTFFSKRQKSCPAR